MAVERLAIRARPLGRAIITTTTTNRATCMQSWTRQVSTSPPSSSSSSSSPSSSSSAEKMIKTGASEATGTATHTGGKTATTATTTTATTMTTADSDLDFTSLAQDGPSPEHVGKFNVYRSRERKKSLPMKRFGFKPPRYYRGPLHPIQPPAASDPTSREYKPGPFSAPRMQQNYDATLSHDLMTIFYEHVPPGTPKAPPKERLRTWDGTSPYHKNRPLRPPRGDPEGTLGLLRKPINWNNVPRLTRITVSARVPEASSDSAYLHTAGMVLQAITGVRAHMTRAKRSTGAATALRKTSFTQKARKPIAVTSELYGEDMWHFLSTLVSIVMPKIKDFTGVRGRSGDSNGNLQVGVAPDLVGGWPEIAVNYDMYPPEMIPGVGITLHTTARSDRDMRLLMASLGFPFLGNHRTRGP